LGRKAVIFLHPTLRNITLSCFDIGDDLGDVVSKSPEKTPLTCLVFDECNISHSGLAAVLSKPKALEKLTLGERLNHTRITGEDLQCKPALFLQVLRAQKDSLQYLKHIGEFLWYEGWPETAIQNGLSLDFLCNLKEMELGVESLFLLLTKRHNTLPSSIQKMSILFPRNPFANLQMPLLVDFATGTRGVPHLDVVMDYQYFLPAELTEALIEDVWANETRVDTVTKLSPFLFNNGVKRFRILLSYGTTCIPPFLYGEPLPRRAVAWDSAIPFPAENPKEASTK
jgi:hypothetical protein